MEELETIKDCEVIDYSLGLYELLRKNLLAEKDQSAEFESIYCPNIEIDPSSMGSTDLMGKPKRPLVKIITVKIFDNDKNDFQIDVPMNFTPRRLLREYFTQKLQRTLQISEKELLNVLDEYEKNFVLNVCGSDEVVFGDKHMLSSYKVISSNLIEQKSF